MEYYWSSSKIYFEYCNAVIPIKLNISQGTAPPSNLVTDSTLFYMAMFQLVCKCIRPYCSIGENPVIQDIRKIKHAPAYLTNETLHALSTVTELLHLVTKNLKYCSVYHI